MQKLFVAASALLAVPNAGCSGGQSGAETHDDPVLPPGPTEECSPADCATRVRAEAAALALPTPERPAFTSTSCSQTTVISSRTVSGSACTCHAADGDRTIGPVGIGCFEYGRSGECLLDDTEFTGCNPNDLTVCEEVCAELDARRALDAQRVLNTSVVFAGCVDNECQSILNVEGQCFANGSYLFGRSYDCDRPTSEILGADNAGAEPTSGLSEVPVGEGPYMEGTSGWIEVGTTQRFVGTVTEGPYFGASAQFFNVEGGSEVQFGQVLDPLEGADDCGRIDWSGTGASSVEPQFFRVETAELVDGAQRHAMAEFSSGTDSMPLFTYYLEDSDLPLEPRFGETYGFHAAGGGLDAPLDVRHILVPDELLFSDLAKSEHLQRGDINLHWTGRGATPLQLRLFVTQSLRADQGPFELRCLLVDDGEFTLDSELLEAAPDGILSLTFTRENRFVEQAGEQFLLTLGRNTVSHQVAFGEVCDNAEVLEACHAYAEHYAAESAECDQSYVQPLAEQCPHYLATSCVGCVEYYECLMQTTSCEDGTLNTDQCGCLE